jgi:hypothetical protein
MIVRRLVLILPLALVLISAVAGSPLTLVVCAPGYPGNTEQAQPVMHDLGAQLSAAAGWGAGELDAVYHERLEPGIDRLSADDAAVALVPLPLYLKYRDALQLKPILQVVHTSGKPETWTLVAYKGAVSRPEDLEGWELAGMPAYSPRFVRNVALSDWGPLPENVEFRFSSRIVSVLRRAAAGEKVAVLLDAAQAEALPKLGFAVDLEVVTVSRPMIGSLVCSVSDRIDVGRQHNLADAFSSLHRTAASAELLETLRIARFESMNVEGLAAIQRSFDAECSGP